MWAKVLETENVGHVAKAPENGAGLRMGVVIMRQRQMVTATTVATMAFGLCVLGSVAAADRNGRSAVEKRQVLVTRSGMPAPADGPVNPGAESFGLPLLGAVACEVDMDCEDDVACTTNRCIDSECRFVPDDAACPDDGLFCNGAEICVAQAGCRSEGDPCENPLPICREDTDSCEAPVTEITLVNGPVCFGGSEMVEACIKLPPRTTFDKVDVFLLFDDTGSFAEEIPEVVDLFDAVVSDLQTALPGVDFAFGVGRFEDYGGPGSTYSGETNVGRPFILNQALVSADTAGFSTLIAAALAATGPGFGGDAPETSAGEALYQAAMGGGFDGDGNGSNLDSGPAGDPLTQTAPGASGDVPGFDSHVGTTDGTLGGAGWRDGALRLILLATDVCSVAPFDASLGIPQNIMGTGSTEPATVFACFLAEPGIARFGFVGDAKSAAGNTVLDAVVPLGAATIPMAVAALNARGIRVIGLAPGGLPTADLGPGPDPSIFLSALARMTGAVDDMGVPLVFDVLGGAGPIASAIVAAVTAAATAPVDVILTADPPPANLTVVASPSVFEGAGPGDSVCFGVTFLGQSGFDGAAFNLNYRDQASNAVLGTIPVQILCDFSERAHPGWNWANMALTLTGNQSLYWSAVAGPPPFRALDPGDPPGRPDPDGSSERVMRGFVVAWAVDSQGRQIRWNHLSSAVTVVNYRGGSAWEYNAYAAQAHSVAHGEVAGTPGTLALDGVVYDQAFDQLLLDFYAPGTVFSSGGPTVLIRDTDLTLMPLDIDLRQDGNGPVTTKARFDIWNMNEFKFSGTERCVSCWDQTLLSNYEAPNHFLRVNLQTDKGKARIEGQASILCEDSVDTPLIGLTAKELSFQGGRETAAAGMNLAGLDQQSAVVRYDVRGLPPERLMSEVVLDVEDEEGGPLAALQPERLSASEKGSLLILPNVEIRWDFFGNLIQDTFITLTNDYPADVRVQLYFVNGDPPLEARP